MEDKEVIRQLVDALQAAQDALNGAPNTVGLHSQIDNAIILGNMQRIDPDLVDEWLTDLADPSRPGPFPRGGL